MDEGFEAPTGDCLLPRSLRRFLPLSDDLREEDRRAGFLPEPEERGDTESLPPCSGEHGLWRLDRVCGAPGPEELLSLRDAGAASPPPDGVCLALVALCYGKICHR